MSRLACGDLPAIHDHDSRFYRYTRRTRLPMPVKISQAIVPARSATSATRISSLALSTNQDHFVAQTRPPARRYIDHGQIHRHPAKNGTAPAADQHDASRPEAERG